MCGRFALWSLIRALMEEFDLEEAELELRPRWNIAPTQRVQVVARRDGANRLVEMRWGLIASWSKEMPSGAPINARSETVAEKPTFRVPFRRRRVLVPADAFYEWRRAGGGRKVPMAIGLRSGAPMALAGIHDVWRPPGGPGVESFAIITTTANELMAPIHDRMPVIVPRDRRAMWLDPEVQDPSGLKAVLAPYPASEMEAHQVSTRVNSPANDGPELVKPVRGPL